MSNHILIDRRVYHLTDDQAAAIASAIQNAGHNFSGKTHLSDVPAGETVKIGDLEFVVLDHVGDTTYLITKNLIKENATFSEDSNNYDGSLVDDICESVAELLEDHVGADNIVEFDVDLTSDDGLKDYGIIRRKCALITSDMYRRYVDILDQHKLNKYWWLATPHSTKRHENELWVKCVSPSGYILSGNYDNDDGVRPFCILESNIFVSR